MPLHTYLKGHLWRALCLLPLSLMLLLGMSIATEFHAHYLQSLHQQQEGLWLFTQCQQPEFYRKLSQHSDACQQMSLLFQKSPFFLAADAAWNALFRQWKGALPILALCSIMTTVVFILTPIYLAWLERRERDRLAIISFHCGDAPFLTRVPLPSKMEHVHASTKLRWRGQIMRV